MPGLLRVETRAGAPILSNGLRLLPFAKSLRLFFPMINFGLVWNRPISILMTKADGEEQVIPIPDRTREIVWTLYGAIGLLTIMTAVVEYRNRGEK
jgi:hypothetical protein